MIPGCDATKGLEIDHWIVPFAKGGPTALCNLARLCSHHHYLRTHKGFELLGGPGHWRWVTPGEHLDTKDDNYTGNGAEDAGRDDHDRPKTADGTEPPIDPADHPPGQPRLFPDRE